MKLFKRLKEDVATNSINIDEANRSINNIYERLNRLEMYHDALISAIEFVSRGLTTEDVSRIRSSQFTLESGDCIKYFVMLKSAIEKNPNKNK
jgi:hypothetical protein